MLRGFHTRPAITGPGAPGGNDHRTVLLVHSDTTHGDTSFIDSGHGSRHGQAGHTITPNGGAHHSTAQAKIGATGIDVQGGKYLSVPLHPDFNLNSRRHWTLDYWWNPSSIAGASVVQSIMGATNADGTVGWHVWADNSNSIGGRHFIFLSGAQAPLTSGTPLSAGVWVHVSGVRDGDTFYSFEDGVLVATTDVSALAAVDPAVDLKIGDSDQTHKGASNVPGDGFFDEIRLSFWPRWRASFTPSTSPYER